MHPRSNHGQRNCSGGIGLSIRIRTRTQQRGTRTRTRTGTLVKRYRTRARAAVEYEYEYEYEYRVAEYEYDGSCDVCLGLTLNPVSQHLQQLFIDMIFLHVLLRLTTPCSSHEEMIEIIQYPHGYVGAIL